MHSTFMSSINRKEVLDILMKHYIQISKIALIYTVTFNFILDFKFHQLFTDIKIYISINIHCLSGVTRIVAIQHLQIKSPSYYIIKICFREMNGVCELCSAWENSSRGHSVHGGGSSLPLRIKSQRSRIILVISSRL